MPATTPIRTCIGCKQRRPQNSLIRLFKNGNELVEASIADRRGRSLYLCPNEDCMSKGLQSKRVQHALRQVVSSGAVERIQKELICRQKS